MNRLDILNFRRYNPHYLPKRITMENKFFGCEELAPATMQEINGGGYVGNVVILAQVLYGLTKGFVSTAPLAGPLVSSLLTSFVDPVIDAA